MGVYVLPCLIFLKKNSPPVLSKSQVQNCKRYSDCANLIAELNLHSERINEVLRLLDPLAYMSHKALSERLQDKYPFVRARSYIDPLLFQGRSIIFNRQTPSHIDRRDPHLGWNPLTTAGDYAGGWLRIRELSLRMWFGPGACVFLRGAVLHHEIEPFNLGQRIVIAHFCHKSLWRDADIELQSSGISD